jgi:hypothetical protein
MNAADLINGTAGETVNTDIVPGGPRKQVETVQCETLVVDCARNTEGLLTGGETETKYKLSGQDWPRLILARTTDFTTRRTWFRPIS